MSSISTLLSLLSGLVVAAVGGKYDKMLEVDMYGSRPGPSESLVVHSKDGYYKYSELGDGVEASTGTVVMKSRGRTAGFRQEVERQKVGSCYSCSTLTDKTGLCQDINTYRQRRRNNQTNLPRLEATCSDQEVYCQVRRIDYRVDNMELYAQWSLERSCSEQCEPFCVTMGGRTKVTYCTSCCRWDGQRRDEEGGWQEGDWADNCNVGNTATSFTLHSLANLLFVMIIIINTSSLLL